MIIHKQKDVKVVAVGLENPSGNVKTGPMIQTYIMGEGNGCDKCASQKICYVQRGLVPVQKKLKEDRYIEIDLKFKPFQRIRLGAWGDPAVVPKSVWLNMGVKKYTGYTHLWRDLSPQVQEYRGFLMASVESIESLELAESLGWKCYYNMVDVALGHISFEEVQERLGNRAISCLNTTSGRSCYDCMLCSNKATKHITIVPHGIRSKSNKKLEEALRLAKEQDKKLVKNLLLKAIA